MEPKRRPWFTRGRLLDALAVAVIVFVAWKIFLAPRMFNHAASAYRAPNVAFQRLDGSTFHVSDARGRVLFLDFFASWCEPCRLEMPMVEAYARAHPEIDLVAVDVGEPRSAASAFAKRYRVGNAALDPTTSAQGYFQIQGFPTIVVIDPQGRIRANWSGFNPAIALAMNNAERTFR